MKYIDHTRSARIIDQARRRVAREHAARHSADTAIANWSNGYTYAEVQLARALPASCQAQWYETAQANFVAWLAAGGFARAEAPGAPDTPAAAPAPIHLPEAEAEAERADGASLPLTGRACNV